jgi:hypothetical protein
MMQLAVVMSPNIAPDIAGLLQTLTMPVLQPKPVTKSKSITLAFT